MKKQYLFLLMIAFATSFVACKKDETNTENKSLVMPSAYDSANFIWNLGDLISFRQNFDAMVNEAKKGRVSGQTVSGVAIQNAFQAGDLSIAAVTNSVFSGKLFGSNNDGWFNKIEQVSGKTYHVDSANNTGGTFGGYLFDENGFEPEQIIEKGLFGAALANYAQTLLKSPGLAEVDQALYVLGFTTHFVNSSDAKHGSAADKYLAVYVARRDKNAGNGIYAQIRFNFIKLQAALKAGEAYQNEKNEAIAAIISNMEKANLATVINYCQTSIANLSLTSLTDIQKAATLHAIGECIGFTTGYKGIQNKKITDAQIDEILVMLNAPATGGGKPALFITDRVNQIQKLQLIINKIQQIYGFTNAEIEDFKKNWIVEQNR
jgi:hypothetical protein